MRIWNFDTNLIHFSQVNAISLVERRYLKKQFDFCIVNLLHTFWHMWVLQKFFGSIHSSTLRLERKTLLFSIPLCKIICSQKEDNRITLWLHTDLWGMNGNIWQAFWRLVNNWHLMDLLFSDLKILTLCSASDWKPFLCLFVHYSKCKNMFVSSFKLETYGHWKRYYFSSIG